MGVPFHIVIEPQEYPQYSAVIDPSQILVLPFSNLGQGSIPARNWIWGHSLAAGHARHWILDDNIRAFYRLNRNLKLYVDTGATFAAIENWADRYENVAMAGMQYESLTPRKSKHPPVLLNTRIYSCILIQNDTPFRWRGRYNEDTDLSLRVLKSQRCTALFYAFPCEKQATLTMKGGNTDELYKGDGRYQMARSLRLQHPDCVKVTYKWGRYQHLVDYSKFKNNPPILKPGVVIPDANDEFGMKMIYLGDRENRLTDTP